MIRRRILPYFEKLPVEKITASTIRRWQNDLMAQGFSPTYLKSIHYYFATYEDANEDDTLWVVIVKNMVDNATEDAE